MKQSFPRYDEAGPSRARGLRRRMTPGEVRLWQRLRGRQLGVAFKRQRPAGPFVVDFYCAAYRLVIEVDGGSHREKGEADLERQAYLEAQSLHVLRFDEREAHRHPDHVVRQIQDWIEATRPVLPPPGEVPAQRAEGVHRRTVPDSNPAGENACSK